MRLFLYYFWSGRYLSFLSSMFFSLLFIKLFDFARKSENRRLPVRVNVLMDEFCNIDLPNSKKYLSESRSRNIDIQCGPISKPACRPVSAYRMAGACRWLRLPAFLGCNDTMTADFISSQCGNITVRVNSASIPMTPMFSLSSNHARYSQGKTALVSLWWCLTKSEGFPKIRLFYWCAAQTADAL